MLMQKTMKPSIWPSMQGDTIEHGEDLDEETAEKWWKRDHFGTYLRMLVNWFTDMMAIGEDAEKMIRPDVLHRTVDQKQDEDYQKKVVQKRLTASAWREKRG